MADEKSALAYSLASDVLLMHPAGADVFLILFRRALDLATGAVGVTIIHFILS